MGGFAALHFAMRYPRMALSCVVAGCGYGAPKGPERKKFQADVNLLAKGIESDGMAAFAKQYSVGPTRVQFKAKDPKGFAEFARQLAEHDAVGAANTFRSVRTSPSRSFCGSAGFAPTGLAEWGRKLSSCRNRP